jgi:predicted nuclease of predicted toxin-antitoxin system
VKLLFDENLSRFLPRALADLYPGSVHVRDLKMAGAPDTAIWEYARGNDLIITTKDTWFQQRALVAGHPPKVICIQTGNCPAEYVEKLLRRYAVRLQEFATDERFAYISLK